MHREELLEILRPEFARWQSNDRYSVLVDHEVPAAPISNAEDALNDPQVRHREMVVKPRHRSGKDFLALGTPLKAGHEAGKEFSSPPELGGDSAAT